MACIARLNPTAAHAARRHRRASSELPQPLQWLDIVRAMAMNEAYGYASVPTVCLDNRLCINDTGTVPSEGLLLKDIDLCINHTCTLPFGLLLMIKRKSQGLDLQVILAQHDHQGVGHDESPLEGHGQAARHGGCQAMARAQMCRQPVSLECWPSALVQFLPVQHTMAVLLWPTQWKRCYARNAPTQVLTKPGSQKPRQKVSLQQGSCAANASD